MSEFDDDLLMSAFAEYRSETNPQIKPTGTGAAYQTVRYRKRVRTTAVAACALTAVLVGGGAFASFTGNQGVAPQPGASSAAPSAVASPSPSASPSASPSPSALPSPAIATSPPPPGSELHGLEDATLDLPVRKVGREHCPSGRVKFRDGKAGEYTRIADVISVDIDGDGVFEEVALITCRSGEGAFGQVIALRPSGSGRFDTIGVVIEIEPSVGAGSQRIENVKRIKPGKPGEILVEVGNHETTYTDENRLKGVFQWRGYRWNGTKFAQSSGPTTFA
ncbi:hypothetical protein ACFQY4_44860 [Catellatospora bangladeshensis]|uniref:Uncharacterized protein n=1 Tax=Catellatospora bangladeshensis TaxID=310355 RepID=A0A8J3JFJ2_9ACTN|nr:hypothetical protein [Catellatospora bangladeshensis]GIF83616.1 hypothetical protein Cba03nite_49650 [Catellatospora bangladeshensis]